ncbi:MAG: cupredoxin domain-containing protein [Candidatus Levybacteria bacterium]|nr:cupredoxin domain-containing protein [Candidatus Levybacteria bacterium]
MSIDKLLVALIGAVGIAFTYWFFLMKKETEVEVVDEVDIKVSRGYSPEVISIPKNKTTKIHFLRTDPTDCLSDVVLSEFKIRKNLPLNKKVTIEVTPKRAGEFPFSCGMNMYHGKVIVKE